MKTNNNSLCPLCGGKRKAGKTTYTADMGTGVVVVRNVDAEICSQCGEEWISNAVAKQLEKITNEARENHHQFEVVAL